MTATATNIREDTRAVAAAAAAAVRATAAAVIQVTEEVTQAVPAQAAAAVVLGVQKVLSPVVPVGLNDLWSAEV